MARLRDLIVPAAACIVLLMCAQTASAGDWDGWTEGRATYYGDDGGTTIHQGSCEFYQLDYHQGTGFDIVALSDAMPEHPGSCGTCYEVACRRAQIEDGYGEKLDRSSTCHDESRRVVVRVTDTCPCVYPANAFSNKRWCCGDRPHIDLSTQAFRKLGSLGDGVMAIRYKRVACPTTPTYLDWDGDHPKGWNGGNGNGGGDKGGGDKGGGGDDGKKGGSGRRMLAAKAPWA